MHPLFIGEQVHTTGDRVRNKFRCPIWNQFQLNGGCIQIAGRATLMRTSIERKIKSIMWIKRAPNGLAMWTHSSYIAIPVQFLKVRSQRNAQVN